MNKSSSYNAKINKKLEARIDSVNEQNSVSSLCPIYGGQLSLLIITPIISTIILLSSIISVLVISFSSIFGILLSTFLLLLIIISYLEGC